MQYVQGSSYFNKINKNNKQFKYLTENISTEVVIIGGGVTGAILGYYFSKNNIDTVIIDKMRVGHGSTGITTALLQYELDKTIRQLEEVTELQNIIKSYKLGELALNEIEKFNNENGDNFDYIKRDTLFYTGKDRDINEIIEEYNLRKENGFDVRLIEEIDNPFSFDLKAGVYGVGGGAEIDPYKFTQELIRVGEKRGNLKIYENTEAIDILYNEDNVEVITKYDYRIRAKIVIAATGFNTSLFTKRNFGIKTTTFNIVTKSLKKIEGWQNLVLIRNNKDPYNYFRTTKDNRIIAGGEDIGFISDIYDEKKANEKYDMLENKLKTMFNKIQDIEIEYRYCGAFASTKDNLGFIGKDPNNDKLYYALGYGANGILFAILAGLFLPRAYLGEEVKELNLFKVDRFDN